MPWLLAFVGMRSRPVLCHSEHERLPEPYDTERQLSLPAGGLDSLNNRMSAFQLSSHSPDPFAGSSLSNA